MSDGRIAVEKLSHEVLQSMSELSYRMTGDFNAAYQIAEGNVSDNLPPYEGASRIWKDYTLAAAGPASDLEWALMTGIRSVECHGLDLASFVPQAWLS